MSQDPELHANGHGSTHTRRYQVALTSQPGGGPVGRPGVWDLRSLLFPTLVTRVEVHV